MPAQQIALILEALLLSEVDIGAVMIWKGEEYPCTAGPIFGGKRLDEGGWRSQARCTIKVRTEVFPDGDQPQEKQQVQLIPSPNFDPVLFRIETINKYHGYVLEIQCEDPNRGA
jgi:hypothetical protein